MTSQASDRPQNLRRSLRITESAFIQYEVLDEREFAEGLERRKLRLGKSQGLQSKLMDLNVQLDEKLFMIKSGSSHLGDCLRLLNEKINAVIQHIPETLESNSALAQSKPYTCQIGAEGMAFAVEQPFEPGTKLSLRFLLESDSRYFEMFCEVIRNVDPPIGATEERPYGVAVEFHGMKATEKETLIHHLFNQETETLRMRRLEIDAMD
jgi:PilZ domain